MELCPFGEPVGPREAIDFCEHRTGCQCRFEMLCHAMNEVDPQTVEVVKFWMTRGPFNCGWRRERMVGEFADRVKWDGDEG